MRLITNSPEPDLLTIAELARLMDLPESTTRYYCNRFAGHLPSLGEGRKKRFKPESLEVLRTIAETMRRDKNAFAVDLALRNGDCTGAAAPVPPIDQIPVQILDFSASSAFANQILSLLENQTSALREIASAMTLFAERLTLPQAVQACPAPDGEGNAPDTPRDDEIAFLRKQIIDMESVHQNDLEQLRKWLTRLGEALSDKQ